MPLRIILVNSTSIMSDQLAFMGTLIMNFAPCTHGIIMVIRVIGKQQDLGLLLSVELLETGGIYNSSYWKIAGLAACYFQGNSWKLGASIIRVIGKQQAQRPAIFRGTLETGVSIIWGIGKQQTPGKFNDQLVINLKL